MKKISTAAANQMGNFPDRRLTIGLDLGDRSSYYCVLDEAGEVLLERKLSTTPEAMKEVFGGMPRSRIALETGMHSPWVSRLLSECGHEVIVAHARNVRLIGESRRKDGGALRLNIYLLALREAHLRSKRPRRDRDLGALLLTGPRPATTMSRWKEGPESSTAGGNSQ